MSTKAMHATDVAEWHGRSHATVRFFLPHSFAKMPVMQVSAAYLNADGVRRLRDLCDEFLSEAATQESEG